MKIVEAKYRRLILSSLPFMYTYITRLGTLFRFSQFFGEMVPIMIMTYALVNNYHLNAILAIKFMYFVLFSVFMYITFFTLYEIGYIINDCVATKYESKPSMRYVDSIYWKYLVGSKLGFFTFLTALAWVIFQIDIFLFVAYGTLTMFLFLLHNRLPLQDRALSYFWLESMRLMMLPYIVIHDQSKILIMFVLIFPELFWRIIRYVRIKYLSYDRKFSTFDLKVSLVSVFMVCIFLFQFDISLIPVLALGYLIIIVGIIISIHLYG